MSNELATPNKPISLMEELEPYRAVSDLWKNMVEDSDIDEENFVYMSEILSDADKPLVIISHDDADGWTSIAIIKLLREKLVGENNIRNDSLITLATGSEYGTCLDIFEKSSIPSNANILILDLNQDNPHAALSAMDLEDNLVARVDHHQTGKQELKAKIVPTEDRSFIDSTSLLTRIVAEKSMDGSIFSEEVLSTFDNLALLGLVGDKKYETKNRIGKAFAKMSN